METFAGLLAAPEVITCRTHAGAGAGRSRQAELRAVAVVLGAQIVTCDRNRRSMNSSRLTPLLPSPPPFLHALVIKARRDFSPVAG